MRIISGKYGGRKLTSPKSNATRPTTDRVRESLFSILANSYSDQLIDGNVLDLFAGTGSLGFEAISRGAANCTFVDASTVACKLIGDNIANLNLGDQCKVLHKDVTKGLMIPPSRRFRLVFLDPPYGMGLGEHALSNLAKSSFLEPDALLILEESSDSKISIPQDYNIVDERRYGGTKLVFLVN